jgi:transmembrane sensor
MKSRPSQTESIEATAAAWLAQRDEGLSPQEADAFAAWRSADARHEAAVQRLERAWGSLLQLRDFRPSAVRHPDRDLLAPAPRASVWHFPARAAAAAAAVVLLAAVGWMTFRTGAVSPSPQDYVTTAGGYQRILLSDGSVMELNSDTSAVVTYTPGSRRVHLDRGEAHFTVAKNPDRPFWVEASGVSVRAVGTAFNVRLGSGEIEVLVTEGKVSVDPSGEKVRGEKSSDPVAAGARGPTYLTVNERTRIATPALARDLVMSAPVVEKVSLEQLRESLAWQSPRLVFVDTPLSEVVAQFNRRNVAQIILADPALATLPVGGSFRAENVEAFVRLIESSGDVEVERTSPNRFILRRKK